MTAISPLCAALALAGNAHGAGFALIEQGVSGMGTAYAGAAATADTVDTLYFNPAGMTRLPGTRAGAALHLVLPQTKFRNEGSTFDSVFMTGATIGGGDGGDAGGLAGIPHASITHQLSDTLWAGLTINVPFGLTTEYDDGWVGRYHAIKSAVQTVNINPSIAFKASERLSLAAGVSAMHLDGEFSNAIDFGGLNQIPVLFGGLGGALGGAVAGTADGKSTIKGDSWGFGYNLGALFEISDDTRVGVHYRSEVEQDVEGNIRFELPTPALAGTFSNAGAKTSIDLPATFSVSGFHQVNPEWALMADYTWTGWSSIPELRFDFDNGLPDGVTTFGWRDTDRFSLGTTYSPSGSDWSYRVGMAFDESPVSSASHRTPRLPDNDRIWLAVGAGFSPAPNLSIDVGYAHIWVDEPVINKSATGEDLTRGALKGRYESSVDILSVEARYTFD